MQKRPITVEDVWALKRLGGPSLSPDGARVAIDVSAWDMEENKSASDLWLFSTSRQGAPPLQLTRHPARASRPAWSPDGRWIAFLSKRDDDEDTQVYLISPDGGEASRLTTLSTGASAVRWFPDGRRLAFISWVWPDLAGEAEQAARLRERAEAKVQARAIETTTFRFWDHWLAEGRVPHLHVCEVETGVVRDLLAGTGLSLSMFDTDMGLSTDLYGIAPDGDEVAITADLSPDPGFRPNQDVVLVEAATGRWRNLTADNPAHDRNPVYSPDGRWLAYTRQRIPNYYADRERLVLHDRKSGETRELAPEWDGSAGPPRWSADSRRLYFLAEERARQPIWVLGIEGTEPRVVTGGGTVGAFDVSAGGETIAFVRSTMNDPPGLFASSADGTGERQLEDINQALTAEWDLGPVEEVTYPGWEGNPVQMWVIHPPSFTTNRRWPLLQIVHGGPHGAWRDEFHYRWNMHLFAARGYLVAAVNYHGSTGWGEAFTDANTGEYGNKELADVEAATDTLIARGSADPERLAAAGGSYGGYMVAWMNGHTDRYRAYVCHAGVYDWVAQMASDAIRGRERALGAFPWDDPDRVLRQSAHSYAAHFKTPTLVIHGELDYRVPVTLGFAYYSTLRMREVPARLLYFPDENHWILKAQNSRLWYRECFDWIERFVPPGPAPAGDPAGRPGADL